MSKKYVTFPNDDTLYLEKALYYYELGNRLEAIEWLEKMDLSIKEPQLITLYVTLLQESYELDKALNFLEEKIPSIQKNSTRLEWDVLYIQLLIDTWQLEQAESLLEKKVMQYEWRGKDCSILAQLFFVIENCKEDILRENKEEKAQLLEKINKVDSLLFYEQKQLLPLLHQLDKEAYVKQAELLLKSQGYHPLLKAYLLEMLLEKNYGESVEMSWFGQIKSVSIADLKPVLDHPYLQKVHQLVDLETLPDMDKEILKKTLFLYVSMTYPFMDLMMDEQTLVQQVKQYHEQGAVHEWIQKLEEWIKRME